jgi:hypothetical protein
MIWPKGEHPISVLSAIHGPRDGLESDPGRPGGRVSSGAQASGILGVGMRAGASTVWLVYQEFQADTPDIVGIYADRRDAEDVAEACRRQDRTEYGWVVYGGADDQEDRYPEWDVDVHIEEHDLHPVRRRRRRAGGPGSRPDQGGR